MRRTSEELGDHESTWALQNMEAGSAIACVRTTVGACLTSTGNSLIVYHSGDIQRCFDTMRQFGVPPLVHSTGSAAGVSADGKE